MPDKKRIKFMITYRTVSRFSSVASFEGDYTYDGFIANARLHMSKIYNPEYRSCMITDDDFFDAQCVYSVPSNRLLSDLARGNFKYEHKCGLFNDYYEFTATPTNDKRYSLFSRM